MNITINSFGVLADGSPVSLYTLSNAQGVKAAVMNYGATLVSVEAPDQTGRPADVILGFDTLADYVRRNHPHFGGVVGRCANRIAHGRFTLDGVGYALAINNGPNHLHGGRQGFDAVYWQGTASDGPVPAVQFTYLSRDGEENYPGNLRCTVRYTLKPNNELALAYSATTDRPTIVNLTNHAYFNLAGHHAGSVREHRLLINADRYTPADDSLIPTGALASVTRTPLDFRTPHNIGERLQAAGGYDHNYVLNPGPPHTVMARVIEPTSGRLLEMFTTEPGVQFYTGNFLAGERGKQGAVYQRHGGFCLEAQHFPDAINHPQFPPVVLRPGEVYSQETAYRFGVV